MDKRTGIFAFVLLALLITVMAWTACNEHIRGGAVYNSMWFTLLWILAATVGCYFISTSSLHRRLPVFLLHVAFLAILAGALTTRLTGKTGQVRLRENQQVSSFFDEWTHNRVVFPFSLSLKSFTVEYYPGTASPANYVSIVELTDAKTGERFKSGISMNNILRYKGYRFYQASFDEDLQGSILSVNHDRWGILLSYTGYFLMFFSMLWILFDKRGRFRFLLKKLTSKTVLIVLLFACIPSVSKGEKDDPVSKPETINRDQAARLGGAWVEYQGRICPVQTLANDFTAKLTGKTRYKKFSGEQFFFGWLFFSEDWKYEPVFKLKSEELKRIAGSKDGYASLADFFDTQEHNILEPYYRKMYGSNKPEGWLREAVKLNDKFYLIEMLQHGDLLKIFPMQDEDGKLKWYAPNCVNPKDSNVYRKPEMTNIMRLLRSRTLINTLDSINIQSHSGLFVDKLLIFQQKEAGDMLPSATHLKAEQIYNRTQIFSALFKVCLTIGFLCLLYFIFVSILSTVNCCSFLSLRLCAFARDDYFAQRRKDAKFYSVRIFIEKIFHVALWVVFIAATVGLGLRTFIGGRLPLSNGYETMLMLAWFSLLTGILARRYSFLIVAFSFLLAGFTLLVAHISSMNPQITPLVPVLQSPLLSIHVLVIMIAYGLCGFMALNSLTALIVWLCGSKKTDRKDYILRMKEISELFMYPATFLMGAGIFIGAVWANISWGRYWGWDPKEVWALVTFLLMGFTFHGKTLTWFRKPLFYHVFVLIIFLSVLMTYFGVNYFLGGKHSYI